MAAIIDYTTLKDNVISQFERAGDTVFAAQLDTFIGLAEPGFNRALLSRRMEATTPLTTIADGTVALPTDFLEARSLYATNGNLLTPLPLYSQDSYATNFPIVTGGEPYAAFISGSTLTIAPAAIRTVTLDYYQKFVGLSGSNATNWIILQHPDLYFASVCAQACLWMRDDQGAVLFNAQAVGIAAAITDRFGLEAYFNAEVNLEFITP